MESLFIVYPLVAVALYFGLRVLGRVAPVLARAVAMSLIIGVVGGAVLTAAYAFGPPDWILPLITPLDLFSPLLEDADPVVLLILLPFVFAIEVWLVAFVPIGLTNYVRSLGTPPT